MEDSKNFAGRVAAIVSPIPNPSSLNPGLFSRRPPPQHAMAAGERCRYGAVTVTLTSATV